MFILRFSFFSCVVLLSAFKPDALWSAPAVTQTCSYRCNCHSYGCNADLPPRVCHEFNDRYIYGPRTIEMDANDHAQAGIAAACRRMEGSFNNPPKSEFENWYVTEDCKVVANSVACTTNEADPSGIKNSDPMTYIPIKSTVAIVIPEGGLRIAPNQNLICFHNGEVTECGSKVIDVPRRLDLCWFHITPADYLRVVNKATVTTEISEKVMSELKSTHMGWEFGTMVSQIPINSKLITKIGCNYHSDIGSGVNVPTVGDLRRNFGKYSQLKLAKPPIVDPLQGEL